MTGHYSKFIILLLATFFLAVVPFQAGFCDCAVEGEVCGDPPTWNLCCEAENYECKKQEGDSYGECVKKEKEKK